MDSLITHRSLGPHREYRYEIAGLSFHEAHRVIGANVAAGFDPVVHNRNAKGEQLRTRDGHLLTVVALHGSSVVSAIEFEQV